MSVIWDLIAKRFSGQTTPEEEKAFASWLQESPDNAKIFEDLQRSWNASAALASTIAPDADSAWERLKARLTAPRPQVRPLDMLRKYWLRAAAALVLMIATVFAMQYILSENETPPPVVQSLRPLELLEVSTADSLKAFDLPDSSSVMLNKNSFLSYARGFSDTARIVYLSGEAYFNVMPGDPRPFIVYAGGTQVLVMGTSFNVKANANEQEVEVSVDEGVVAFRELGAPDNSAHILKKSDMIRFDKTDRTVHKDQAKTNDLWWRKVEREAKKVEQQAKKFFNKIKRKKK